MFWQYFYFVALLNGALGQPAIPNFVPFGTTYGDAKMARPLDSLTPRININICFPFFGKSYDVIQVYSHGLILFGNVTYALPHQPPGPFPLRNFVCAAPYWADTDLTKDPTSDIFYREIVDDQTLSQISSMVRNGFPNLPVHQLLWAFVATWYRVPAHQAGPGRNTFQAIIATNGLYSLTIFTYHKLEWSAGAWGGYPQIGFNAGDQVNYWALESSFSADVINAVQESNVGRPGQFIFLTNGNISSLQCNSTEGLQSSPFRGSMHGGYLIRFFGLCFPERSYIVEIDDQPIDDCQFTSTVITCTMPMLVEGRLRITVLTSSRQLIGETDFLSMMPETNADFILSNHYSLDHLPLLAEDRRLPLYFIKNNLTANYLFNLVIYEYSTQYNVLNGTFHNRRSRRLETEFNALNLSSIHNLTLEFSSIFPLSGEPTDCVRALDISFELVVPTNGTISTIWNGAKKFIVRPFIVSFMFSTNYCPAWSSVETVVNTRNMTSHAPQCPCRVRTTWDQEQFGFSIDPACDPNKSGSWNCRFHRGARGCYRRRSPSSDVGMRCCYDNAGTLITNRNLGSGGLIAHFPDASRKLSTFRYFFADVLSYASCCGTGSEVLPTCNQYVTYRPTGSCVNLIPLPPVVGRGDPHFSTLDQNSYTFNGHGEYTLISSFDRKFEIQVRLARLLNSSILGPSADSATAITAFAIKNDDQSRVQVELIPQLKTFEMQIDGKRLEFTLMKDRDEIATASLIYSDDQQLIIRQTDVNTISISYGNSGLQFLVHLRPQLDFLDLVTIMPSSFKENRQFQGLLGGFQGLSYPNKTLVTIDYNDEKSLFAFGETWRTDSLTSIFHYRFQDSHAQHQDIAYRPVFQEDLFKKYANTSRYRSAEEACRGIHEREECMYDVLISNDVTMVKSHETYQTTVQQISNYTALVTIDIGLSTTSTESTVVPNCLTTRQTSVGGTASTTTKDRGNSSGRLGFASLFLMAFLSFALLLQ